MEKRQSEIGDVMKSPDWEAKSDIDKHVNWEMHAYGVRNIVRFLRTNNTNHSQLLENVVNFCDWLCSENLEEFESEESEKAYFGNSYDVVA